MNCCCRSATPAWDCPGTRQIRSLTPSLLPRLTAPAWDFASAARLSNRMVVACGLPTPLHAAQVFASPYPPEPRQMKTHEVAPALFIIHEAAAGRETIQGGNATIIEGVDRVNSGSQSSWMVRREKKQPARSEPAIPLK